MIMLMMELLLFSQQLVDKTESVVTARAPKTVGWKHTSGKNTNRHQVSATYGLPKVLTDSQRVWSEQHKSPAYKQQRTSTALKSKTKQARVWREQPNRRKSMIKRWFILITPFNEQAPRFWDKRLTKKKTPDMSSYDVLGTKLGADFTRRTGRSDTSRSRSSRYIDHIRYIRI